MTCPRRPDSLVDESSSQTDWDFEVKAWLATLPRAKTEMGVAAFQLPVYVGQRMASTASSIGVSIATKDRWDDVAITLDQLRARGLDSLETIVIDDGSATAMPSRFGGEFPWVKFIRSEEARGAAFQRNRIAKLLTGEFILALDDDSSPIAGDLEAAASWLRAQPRICALAFRVTSDDAVPALAADPPFPVKEFVGCGALIKRELFLALGGYEERFGFYSEEGDFCLKALQQGHETHLFPSVAVQHRLTTAARDHERRTRIIIRNEMLVEFWHYPFPICYFRALRYGPMQILKNPARRAYWKAILSGWMQGVICYFAWPKPAGRLSWKQFREWEKWKRVGEIGWPEA